MKDLGGIGKEKDWDGDVIWIKGIDEPPDLTTI